jgi:ankyrin repeat protein
LFVIDNLAIFKKGILPMSYRIREWPPKPDVQSSPASQTSQDRQRELDEAAKTGRATDEINKFKERVRKLIADIQAYEVENNRLEKEMSDLKAQLKRLEIQKENLIRTVGINSDEILTLQAQIDELTKKYMDNDQRLKMLEANLKMAHIERYKKVSQLIELEAERDANKRAQTTLRNRVAQGIVTEQEIEERLNRLEEEFAAYSSQAQEKRVEASKGEAAINAVGALADVVEKDLQNTEIKKKKVEDEMKHKEAENKEAEDSLKKMEEAKPKFEADLRSMRAQVNFNRVKQQELIELLVKLTNDPKYVKETQAVFDAAAKAIEKHDYQTLFDIISKNNDILTQLDKNTKDSLLTLAAKHNNVKAARALVKSVFVDLDAQDVNLNTALHISCMKGYITIIKILLGLDYESNGERTAKNYLMNADQRLPLYFLARFTDDSLDDEMIEKLIPKSTLSRNQNPSLRKESTSSPKSLMDTPDKAGSTMLHAAAFCGNAKITRALLNAGVSINPKNSKGETPFHISLRRGERKVFDLLRTCNPLITEDDKHFLIGATSTLETLDASCKAESFYRSERAKEVLCGALIHGNTAVAEHFLKNKVKLTPHAQNDVIYFICNHGHIGCLNLVLEYGFDINCQNGAHIIGLPVIAAMHNNDRACLVRILSHPNFRADIECKSASIAVECLINATPKDEKRTESLLVEVIRRRLFEYVDVLIEKGANIYSKDSDSRTPLSAAIRSGDTDLVTKLVLMLKQKGINVMQQGSHNRSPYLDALDSVAMTTHLLTLLDKPEVIESDLKTYDGDLNVDREVVKLLTENHRPWWIESLELFANATPEKRSSLVAYSDPRTERNLFYYALVKKRRDVLTAILQDYPDGFKSEYKDDAGKMQPVSIIAAQTNDAEIMQILRPYASRLTSLTTAMPPLSPSQAAATPPLAPASTAVPPSPSSGSSRIERERKLREAEAASSSVNGAKGAQTSPVTASAGALPNGALSAPPPQVAPASVSRAAHFQPSQRVSDRRLNDLYDPNKLSKRSAELVDILTQAQVSPKAGTDKELVDVKFKDVSIAKKFAQELFSIGITNPQMSDQERKPEIVWVDGDQTKPDEYIYQLSADEYKLLMNDNDAYAKMLSSHALYQSKPSTR